jgi:hypothetical protein
VFAEIGQSAGCVNAIALLRELVNVVTSGLVAKAP